MELQKLLKKISSTADFYEVDFTQDINATNTLGDNALHCVAIWGDVEAARLLIDAGVNINKFGERGFTPLHNACMCGHLPLVEFLVANGADLFAQSEGELPFTIARLGCYDAICDYLSPLMQQILQNDKKAYVKSRINQLMREIVRLEAQLKA